MFLVNNDVDKIINLKDILEEEECYFEEVYRLRNMDFNCLIFKEFFEIENVLLEEIVKMCEGVMFIDECEIVLKIMENNKIFGIDGLMFEFYCYFWKLFGLFMVNSFNYVF